MEDVSSAFAASDAGTGGLMSFNQALQKGGDTLFNFMMNERNWNRMKFMSNTAHQREVRDLKAAGLNPILSVSKGGPGASSPSSSATVATTAPEAVSAAAQLALTDAQIKDVNSAAALKDAQTGDILKTQLERIDLMIAQKKLLWEQREKTGSEDFKILHEIDNLKEMRRKLLLDISHSAYDLERSKNESEFQKTLGGDIAPWIKFIKSVFK